jgi:hypothetical protein
MNVPEMILLWDARWHFAADMNGDGVFTIADVWLMVKYVYFAPGDAIIFAHMTDPELPTLLTLFEPDASWLYGWASGVLSGLVWFVVLWIIAAHIRSLRQRIEP